MLRNTSTHGKAERNLRDPWGLGGCPSRAKCWEQVKNGWSHGDMLLKSGLMKLEKKIAEYMGKKSETRDNCRIGCR